MKLCVSCRETKPESEFWKSSKNRDGLQYHCKDCSRQKRVAYIARDRESHNAKERARYEWKKQRVWDYLCDNPCPCGEADPVVLEFDHIRGEKEFNVSDGPAKGYSLERIFKEIAKCQVLCANCHRRITFVRRNQRRRSSVG